MSDTTQPSSSISRRHRRVHPLRTILVWGPWVVALLALLGVAGVGWIDSAHEARLEGAFLANQRMHEDMREEIRLWESYVVVLQRALTQSGIVVPVPPLHVVKQQSKTNSPTRKEER